jgi:hypothetical protein
MWVIDIRHWLDDSQSGPAVPRLKSKVNKLTEIIGYATSIEGGISVDSPPKCLRRPKRRSCKGQLDIQLDPAAGQIYWKCPVCSDEAVVSGWKGLIWDMSNPPTYFQ